MARETELKLELEPEAAAFMEASDLLSGPAKILKQRAVYFDTPGKRLKAEGMSLRIRQEGRKRTQTLKIADGPAAGLFARSEWEMPVKADQPVLQGDGPLIDLLGQQVHQLMPAFEIVVERRAWLLDMQGSRIELVVDRGAARVAGRSATISEIELELKSGDPAVLFALARNLDRIAPVRLGVLSKAERGYGLLGPAIEAHKADPVALTGEMTAGAAFCHIGLACIRQYRLNEALLLESWQPVALHQMRVALRRLRACLTLFKPMVDDLEARHFKSALRALFAILGEARNLDVLRDRLSGSDACGTIDEARDHAYKAVRDALTADAGRGLMLDLVEWLTNGAWRNDPDTAPLREGRAADFAVHALDRQRKRIVKHGKRLQSGDDDHRHRVRKDAKKLRYASEFFASLFDTARQEKRHGQWVGTLERLQDELGALNDQRTARELIDRLLPARHEQLVALLDERPARKAIKRADKDWKQLVDRTPFWR